MVGTISLDLIIHECFRLMSEIHGEIILFSLILDGYNDFLLPNPVMAIVCTYTITTKQHDGESFIMYVIIRFIVLEVTRGYFKLRTDRKNVKLLDEKNEAFICTRMSHGVLAHLM